MSANVEKFKEIILKDVATEWENAFLFMQIVFYNAYMYICTTLLMF